MNGQRPGRYVPPRWGSFRCACGGPDGWMVGVLNAIAVISTPFMGLDIDNAYIISKAINLIYQQ
jgi:hypothetical protein